jgi:uncharacterized membrane-anchored protein
MTAVITVAVLGILLSVIGVINMTGNISTVHGYHRKRVTEENRKAFGKLVGAGTLIIGLAMIVYGILLFAFEQTQNEAFSVIGVVILLAGIVAGSALSFYAMKKYNGGIF